MKAAFFFIILSISLSVIPPTTSEQYTVGDEDQWTTGAIYLTWSQKYNFTVGDILDFQYVRGQHNVYEVTEDIYKSCDTSNSGGVVAMYVSGNDKITLTVAKQYWFICDIPDHCKGGMRFGVDVKQGANSAPTPVATPPPPPSNTGGLFARGKRLTVSAFLVVLGIFASM